MKKKKVRAGYYRAAPITSDMCTQSTIWAKKNQVPDLVCSHLPNKCVQQRTRGKPLPRCARFGALARAHPTPRNTISTTKKVFHKYFRPKSLLGCEGFTSTTNSVMERKQKRAHMSKLLSKTKNSREEDSKPFAYSSKLLPATSIRNKLQQLVPRHTRRRTWQSASSRGLRRSCPKLAHPQGWLTSSAENKEEVRQRGLAKH